MFKQFKVFLIGSIVMLPFFFSSGGYAKPPKPGPESFWVTSHTKPDGTVVPGDWKYGGPSKNGKVWVPGHHAPMESDYQSTGNLCRPPENVPCGFRVIMDGEGAGYLTTSES
jgi:hypothetical protein